MMNCDLIESTCFQSFNYIYNKKNRLFKGKKTRKKNRKFTTGFMNHSHRYYREKKEPYKRKKMTSGMRISLCTLSYSWGF